MLTLPNCCIQVALSINRATCFDTSHGRYPARQAWGFCRVLLADSKHKGGNLSGNDSHRSRGFVNWRNIANYIADIVSVHYPCIKYAFVATRTTGVRST
jgi:hypothetical protein